MDKKHFMYLFLGALMTVCLISCSDDDTPALPIDPDIPVKDISFDFSDLVEDEEPIPEDIYDPFYKDYIENVGEPKYTVYVKYEGNTATISGDYLSCLSAQPEVNGAHVVLKSSNKVKYVLEGSSDNGSFKIYSDSRFVLTLNGVSLKNPTGAAINSQKGLTNNKDKQMYLHLADGTENTLSDGAKYVSTSDTEQEKGTIFNEGEIIFSGKGKLNINSQGKNGVASDDHIRFRPGSKIFIQASNGHGVKGKDGIFVSGGVLNISVSKDGAKGLNSDANIEVKGGRTTIVTSGKSAISNENGIVDTTSCAGIKCDGFFAMQKGIVNIKSTGEGGKGLNIKQDIELKGGEINIVALGSKGLSSPKGIKGDQNCSVSKTNVYAYSANSKPLDIFGTLNIDSSHTEKVEKGRFFILKY